MPLFEVFGGGGGVRVGRKNAKANGGDDAFTAGESTNSLTVNRVVAQQLASEEEKIKTCHFVTAMK